MILVGLLFGRWWIVVPLGAIAWTVLVVVAAAADVGATDIPIAAGLAAVNTAFGVLRHRFFGALVQVVRRRGRGRTFSDG